MHGVEQGWKTGSRGVAAIFIPCLHHAPDHFKPKPPLGHAGSPGAQWRAVARLAGSLSTTATAYTPGRRGCGIPPPRRKPRHRGPPARPPFQEPAKLGISKATTIGKRLDGWSQPKAPETSQPRRPVARRAFAHAITGTCRHRESLLSVSR